MNSPNQSKGTIEDPREAFCMQLLKPSEAAVMLAIGERKLWELQNRGEIPAVRIGRSVRYDPEDLAKWIEKQKTKTRQ